MPKSDIAQRDRDLSIRSLIVGLFAIALVLEYITPPEFVFGYFYIGGILLASARLSRRELGWVTATAIALTLSNVWFPHEQPWSITILLNRLIAALALGITGWLSDRIRRSEEAIARQRAQLQAQAQLAQLREDLAATLTHDLRTPLLGAIETLSGLEQEYFGPVSPAQQKILSTMKRSHQTSLKLVETLLDIYRNDAEGLSLQLAPVDLTALTERVAGELSGLAASRQVYLAICHSESDFRRSLWVNGDAFQLQRVLTNLLSNAVNHSRRGDRVEIVLESQSDCHVVKVLDSGAGLRLEELPHLFERFFQGQSDRQSKGAGLGLYLSRQIITAHGGTIWAENLDPGGALFAFRLPAYPMPAATA
jgi:two-component system NarL family sensor kinase